MSTKYSVEHYLEQYYNDGFTSFMNPLEFNTVRIKVNKSNMNVYSSYEDCVKKIIYKGVEPDIRLLELSGGEVITHQEILKCMFTMGIKEDMYGDIIVRGKKAYVYCLPSIVDYIILNFKDYSNKIINIDEVDIDLLNDYKPEYIDKEIIVSSLRIDNVLSSLLNLSRNEVLYKFKDKEVILNYQVINKYTTNLKEGDVFSVRRYGKFRFDNIKCDTKKGGKIIKILKYK